tara:strand:- start:151 stop:459 length:309 start_codon:yes stop_codon:yes gene_type:complete
MNFVQFLESKGFERSTEDDQIYSYPSQSEWHKQLENSSSNDPDRQLEAKAWVEKYPVIYYWDNNDYDGVVPELQVYDQCINDDGVLDSESYGFIKIPSILLC